MAAPIIEARALDKSFGFAAVLRGVNLRVSRGSAAMICGSNGSGKSTLISLLAGVRTPTAGDALLFGSPSRSLGPALRQHVGLLTHQSFLYPNLTARENLAFSCALYRISDPRERIDHWLGRVGLAIAADERVRTFSRGMEQRLALARVLISAPDAILMDEPFTALDAEGIAVTIDLLQENLQRGCALIFTAHTAIPPTGLSPDLYQLAHGRLIKADGPPLEAHHRLLATAAEPPLA